MESRVKIARAKHAKKKGKKKSDGDEYVPHPEVIKQLPEELRDVKHISNEAAELYMRQHYDLSSRMELWAVPPPDSSEKPVFYRSMISDAFKNARLMLESQVPDDIDVWKLSDELVMSCNIPPPAGWTYKIRRVKE